MMAMKGKLKGKGKGKGKSEGRSDLKLGVEAAAKTLWVSNVAIGLTFKDLKVHCDQAGPSKWAELFTGAGKGTGAIAYGSEEEAEAALIMLNGSLLNNQALQFELWPNRPM